MKLKDLIQQFKRIIAISYKPTKEELIALAKACLILLFIIGLLGYFIFMLISFIGG